MFLTFIIVPMKIWGVCTSETNTCAFYSPYDQVSQKIQTRLEEAKESITIVTDEIELSLFSSVLEKKLKQGLPVEVLVDYRKSFLVSVEQNKTLAELSAKYPNFKMLKLPVLRGAQAQMHNRFMIIDQKDLLIFSGAFTAAEMITNYNNLLKIADANILKKYLAETNELKKLAIAFCEAFNKYGHCTPEAPDLDNTIHQYLLDGAFNKSDLTITTNSLCYRLQTKDAPDERDERDQRVGILNELNRPSFADIYKCFNDISLQNKVQSFLQKVDSVEALVGEQDSDAFKVYFSPEDNILSPVLEEVKRTLKNPAESFVYISSSFITHPKLAITLQELKKAGVRVRVFFDRNYFVNDDYKSQLNTLTPLGFYGDPNLISTVLWGVGAKNPFHPSDFKNSITLFDNRLLENNAKNSNNWIIVGAENDLTLLSSSAEWSQNSLRLNDENLLITKDKDLIAIYVKENLSQLFTYRYLQNIKSSHFQEELNYFTSRVPCLQMLLGIDKSCGDWTTPRSAPIVFSLKYAPANPNKHKVMLYSSQLNNNAGGAIELSPVTDRWIGVLDAQTSWWYSYHFYVDGLSRDYVRNIEAMPLNLPRIESSLIWAK